MIRLSLVICGGGVASVLIWLALTGSPGALFVYGIAAVWLLFAGGMLL